MSSMLAKERWSSWSIVDFMGGWVSHACILWAAACVVLMDFSDVFWVEISLWSFIKHCLCCCVFHWQWVRRKNGGNLLFVRFYYVLCSTNRDRLSSEMSYLMLLCLMPLLLYLLLTSSVSVAVASDQPNKRKKVACASLKVKVMWKLCGQL